MTDKLYGLDDIPEGLVLDYIHRTEVGFTCWIIGGAGKYTFGARDETPQLALHKSIQKARGEM